MGRSMRFTKIRQVIENLERPIPRKDEDPSHIAIELLIIAILGTLAIVATFLGLIWVIWHLIKTLFGV